MTGDSNGGPGDPDEVIGERPVGAADAVEARPEVGFVKFLRYFLLLGSLGFGGPIATVGYMQRDLVEQRDWMTKEDLLDGIALGQTMPGPLAAQVAMWVGYLRRGALGALGTAAAFVAPSFLMVVVIGFLYVRYQGIPAVQSVFYGVSPAVIAIVVLAAVKLARLTDGRDIRLWTISAIVGIATAATGSEVALLIVGAGLAMLVWDAPPDWMPWRKAASALGLPLKAAPLASLAGSSTLFVLGLFFLKAGAFIFGSGLAIVPFLRQGVVVDHHWLTEHQFLDAVAVGLITPGPVVITAAFIGYVVAGLPGAIVSAIAIFTPIYLGVVIPGRWFIRHRHDRSVRAFVRGATAGAAGAIAGATLILGRGVIIDLPTVLIAVVSLAYLRRLKFRLKEPALVAATAVLGLLLHGT
ncbi:MAG: chromate transporter [Candidatus Dormibacteria bacterium]